ncbi:MAG TPA: acetylglutamate kinase [Candidatus Cybelea sp.]
MTHDYASTLVVKYGGNAMAGPGSGPDPLLAEVAARWHAGQAVVLVHGGGPEIDAALAQRGVESERIDGQRVTDAATLEVTEAVLCGSLNKRLVRACTTLGLPAAGISGQDGGTLIGRRAKGINGEDLGYVGEIARVEPKLIRALLAAGFLPVVAPLAIAQDASHAYNVNADLAAGAIAAALAAEALVLVTNVPRVLRDVEDPTSGIDRLTADQASIFAHTSACRDSMKPKLLAAAAAARNGATAAYICTITANPISSALSGDCTIVAAR